MTILEEQKKRQQALKLAEDMQRRYGMPSGVTHPGGCDPAGVTKAAGAVNPAVNGVRAGSEGPPKEQKNRGPSAAARAPEAAAREIRKTKPNRRENEFMLNLMVLRNTLKVNAPACRERARMAGKWVWRDMRLMLALVCKVQEAMLRTMPDSRDEYYAAYARHGHYEMRIDGPVRTSRHLLVTDTHLAAICEAAMKSECVLCMRDGEETGRCPLREALLESAPPTDLQANGMIRKCEYREAAGKLLHGEDVTV